MSHQHHHHHQSHHHTHHVIKQIPLNVQLAFSGPGAAKSLLNADRSRAHKFLAGVHPCGPTAFKTPSLRKKPGTGSGSGSTSAGTGASGSIDVTDAGVTYTAQVGVGSPPQEFTLLIDTGSSNTWVGAGTKYKPTSTSHSTGKSWNVSYGSGSVKGTEFNDQVTLAPELVIASQGIGVASTATGFQDVDGILGIGPVDLTEGTTSDNQPIPTVTDNLFTQGLIPTNSIGISYNPSTSAQNVANGEMTFGGTDNSKFTGSIAYVPITSTSPASQYWGIDQTITYGSGTGSKTILQSTAGIVDTGTTLLLLATDAFKSYQTATGATMDSATGLLTVTESQFENMKSLFFKIGSNTYELTADAQIWPRALNSQLGGDANKIYLVTADLGSNSGQGLDFIDGFVFLQRFYAVYDTTNSRVGFAKTQFTSATTN